MLGAMPPRRRRVIPSAVLPEPSAERAGKTSAPPLDPLKRGDLLHRLLQFLAELPPARRQDAGARFLTAAAVDLSANVRDGLATEALAVLEHPELAVLFGSQSRAEVAILARLPGRKGAPEIEVSGRIDRLVVSPEAVLIADFKTDAPPARPEQAPAAYVTQLALYRAVIGRLYPGRRVRAYLIWTAAPAMHEIAAARLDTALERVTSA